MDNPRLPQPRFTEVDLLAKGYLPESAGYGNQYNVENSGFGGLTEYWRILRRRKGTVVAFTFVGILGAIVLALPQTPVYQARTALEIQDLNENFMNMKQVTAVSEGAGYTALADIQTQIKLLQSESLVKRVLAKLKANPASISVTDAGEVQASRIAAWRKALNLPMSKPSVETDPAMAARNLKVRAAGQTRIVELLYDSTDPVFAAGFANTLAQEFIESNMEARWKMSQHTGEWLSRQLEDMRIKLERSEHSLQSYARSTGLMFTSASTTSEKTNIAEDKLRQLQEESSKAQGDRITKQSRWEMTKSGPAEALPDVLTDNSLRGLRDKITELSRERAELITTYTAKHIKVQRVEAQIAPLEAALQRESAAIVGRLRNDYEGALRREQLLVTDYANQSRLVSDQAEKSIQYNILKRELDSNRQLYEAMLQRVKESSIASAMRASNIRIVDLAEPPKLPYKPSLPMNAALGMLTGLFAGTAFVLLRERADCSLQNPGDTPFWLNVPELGVIPRATKQRRVLRIRYSNKPRGSKSPQTLSLAADLADPPNGDTPAIPIGTSNGAGHKVAACVELISWQRKPGPVAESFRSLLTSILFSGENGTRPRVLVVTSASPMEGKTTVTSNLGIAFADIHRRVLIIDGDLRKPRMHQVFGVTNEFGLTTLLKSDPIAPDALESVPRKTSIPGLFVLTSGPANQNSENLLYDAKLPELLAKFKSEFDMVIIDTPPMLLMPDARVLGRLADAVILVTRAGQTNRDEAMAAYQRFAEDRTRVLGTILNNWNSSSSASRSSRDGYFKRYAHYSGRNQG